jgi:hypothetical protein
MGLSRSRTLYLIALLALIVLSLRPEPTVDAVVDAVFAPAQMLGVLAAPLRWLSFGAVRAAQSDLDASAPEEIESSRALVTAERSSARPTERDLTAGRGFVLAEVVSYFDKHRDEMEIAYNPRAVLAPGMPVVCGDVYVGRVKSVGASDPGRARVALVTGASFRVGAAVECESSDGPPRRADLVVGGLPSRRATSDGLRLAAQFTSDRKIDHGTVRVSEIDSLEADPYRKLADGYLLGELKPSADPAVDPPSVEAKLAYAGGLSEVAVLHPDPAFVGSLFVRDPFDPAAWIETHVLVDGTPSFWRAGVELAAGSDRGVAERAAIAVGPRLVGRVASARIRGAHALLLADPGFQVNAWARIEGEEEPLALGRLTSLGLDRSTGALILRAEGSLPQPSSPADRARRATLFTGAGDLGIPAGLWIGTAEIPADDHARRILVLAPQAHQALSDISVWRCAPAGSEGSTP